MLEGGPWPSEEQMKVVANFCNIGGERTASYNRGPDARETAMLEAAAADIRRVLAQWQPFRTDPRSQGRKIIIAPVSSWDINAWNTNTEDVKWAAGQPIAGESVSLICVPQGIIEFFMDAPEELEAVVAHEIGHAVDIPCYLDVRPRTSFPPLVQQACESRADAFALNVFIAQHKNPYAVAGAFGRLEMFSGDTSTGFFARLKNLPND